MQREVHHVVPCLNQQIGGPAVSVPALADALSSLGLRTTLWCNDYPELGALPETTTPLHAEPVSAIGKKLRGYNPALFNAMIDTIPTDSIVHSHGLWMFPNFYARKLAERKKCTLIISPRGMLAEWALRFHGYRKKIAWALAEGKNMHRADAFHATSLAEADALKRLGLSQNTVIIPNGLHSPHVITHEQIDQYQASFTTEKHKKYLLFLSRIHPKKGLGELLRAWQQVQSEQPDWHLLIAGADIDGYLAHMLNEVHSHLPEQSFTYLGHVTGLAKEALYAMSDLFILPTHSENFGLVIGEALLRAVPVIISKNAPWEDSIAAGAGWHVEVSTKDIVTVLRTALQTPPQDLRAMGALGKAYVENRYAWEHIAKEMYAFYSGL